MYSRIDLLSAAKGPEQDQLLELMAEIQVEEGAWIEPNQGAAVRCFIILAGFVRVEDELLGSWLLPPGTCFGLEDIFLGGIQGQRYRAASRCDLLTLERSALTSLLASQSSVAQNLQVELARVVGSAVQRRLARLARRL